MCNRALAFSLTLALSQRERMGKEGEEAEEGEGNKNLIEFHVRVFGGHGRSHCGVWILLCHGYGG